MAALITAVATLSGAAPASASITIGQLAPGSPSSLCMAATVDGAQASHSSGNTYTAPATGTITSWSHNAGPGAGQMFTMKMFRANAAIHAGANSFMAVGHDGPRPLVPGAVNTFPTNLPVRKGDFLGFNTVNSMSNPNACAFLTDDGIWAHVGDVADGQSGDFSFSRGLTPPGRRSNISAVLVPSNAFQIVSKRISKERGGAVVVISVPNPGTVDLSGKGVGATRVFRGANPVAPGPKQVDEGTVGLIVLPIGKKKKRLFSTGRVKLRPSITYTPTAGDPSTQSVKLKLRKQLKRRR